jgi:anaerobic ribonucleoside-triphosphate reductase activating protein
VLQSFNGGIEYTVHELVDRIQDEYDLGWIDSIILTGGEPLHQEIDSIINLIKYLYGGKYTVWLYTSYLFDDVPELIKKYIDYIVDGPFDINMREEGLRYRGSSNQRIFRKISDVIDGTSMWQEVVDID